MNEIILAGLGVLIGFNGALALVLCYLTKKTNTLNETLKHDWELRQLADRHQAKIPYYDGLGKLVNPVWTQQSPSTTGFPPPTGGGYITV